MAQTIAMTLRMDAELYRHARKIAASRKISFTAMIQELVAEQVAAEERKAWYDAFTQDGGDQESAEVEYAVPAQREVLG